MQNLPDNLPGIDDVPFEKLVFVRATAHKPVQLADGTIEETAPWKGRKELEKITKWHASGQVDPDACQPVFRNSVHGSLNHRVAGHAFNDWSGDSYVIVTPLSQMISANGPPARLNTVDTWWALAPHQTLRMLDAILVTPDIWSELKNDEVINDKAASSGVKTKSVVYATSFNQAREDALLSKIDFKDFAYSIASNNPDIQWTSKDVIAELQKGRKDRDPVALEIIDKYLIDCAKLEAIDFAIEKFGTVKAAHVHSWQAPFDKPDNIAASTEALATAIGTKSGGHYGGPDWTAMKLVSEGLASSAFEQPGVTPQTKELAEYLTNDKDYAAWSDAVAHKESLTHAISYRDVNFPFSPETISIFSDMLKKAVDRTPSPNDFWQTDKMPVVICRDHAHHGDIVSRDDVSRIINIATRNLTVIELIDTALQNGSWGKFQDQLLQSRPLLVKSVETMIEGLQPASAFFANELDGKLTKLIPDRIARLNALPFAESNRQSMPTINRSFSSTK